MTKLKSAIDKMRGAFADTLMVTTIHMIRSLRVKQKFFWRSLRTIPCKRHTYACFCYFCSCATWFRSGRRPCVKRAPVNLRTPESSGWATATGSTSGTRPGARRTARGCSCATKSTSKVSRITLVKWNKYLLVVTHEKSQHDFHSST